MMKPDVEEDSFDLNFEFPRPREQQMQGIVDENIFYSMKSSGYVGLGEHHGVQGFSQAAPNTKVKLIYAVLTGRHGNEVEELVHACGGVDILSQIKLRIQDKARIKVEIETKAAISNIHVFR